MAGLRKPTRKQSSSSPNVVLVIFLVLFVLVSIGLGIFAYYGYADKEKLVDAAKSARTMADAAKLAADYYKVSNFDARLAVGETLAPDQKTEYEGLRKTMLEEAKFSKEAGYEAYRKAMEEWSKKLEYDPAGKLYKKTYKAEVASLTAELEKVKGQLATTQDELTKSRAQFAKLQTDQDAFWKKAIGKIEEGNTTLLAKRSEQTDEMTKSIKQVLALNKELADLNTEKAKDRARYEALLREKNAQIEELKATSKTEVTTITRSSSEPHALFLDISRGKALWDHPRGKITRAEMARREVTINIGSADGVRPQLTFNVFGVGPYGGPEKLLKATIEVTRVLDDHSSLARITSMYDAEGQEIVLTHAGRTRAQREAEAALREGDLLFNMFWGARVAVAGAVHLDGPPSHNPAEAMRQLNDFMHVLSREGMTVDAYLDLTDGAVKGAITNKTRFLILGDSLPIVGVKEAEAERHKLLNEASAAMRKKAVARGMFIISSENFLNVTGYRSPRSASDTTATSSFRPSLPGAGTTIPVGILRPRRPPAKMPPMEEKEGGEEKKGGEKMGE